MKIDRSITKETRQRLASTWMQLRDDNLPSEAETYRLKYIVQRNHLDELERIRSVNLGSMYAHAALDSLDRLLTDGWTPPANSPIQFTEAE